jgi:hypothetical protein
VDGAAAGGELTVPAGDVQFRLATAADDAALRRLLRDNPMGGDVRLSLEREPGYFAAAAIEGAEHRTIVAEAGGRVVCAGSVSVRLRYVNGTPTRVGYLGGLRLDAVCRNRMSILRGGYAAFRQLHEAGRAARASSRDDARSDPSTPVSERTREDPDGPGLRDASFPPEALSQAPTRPGLRGYAQTPARRAPAVYLTSIAADNRPARRLLERGLPGMPTYRFLGEFVTLVVRRTRDGSFSKPAPSARRRLRETGLSLHYGNDSFVPEFVGLLNGHAAGGQFAPAWTVDDFLTPDRCPGLAVTDFRLVRSADGRPVACAAFWDQRTFKQTVVRGYAPRLRRLRPFLNIGLALVGRPTLPAVGRPLRLAFVSHIASDPARPDVIEQLVRLLYGPAHTRGVDYLTLGFDARDPRLPQLRRALRPREYLSRLYAVHWDDEGADVARGLDGRLLAPEVALL